MQGRWWEWECWSRSDDLLFAGIVFYVLFIWRAQTLNSQERIKVRIVLIWFEWNYTYRVSLITGTLYFCDSFLCMPMATLAMRPLKGPMLLMPSMPAERRKRAALSMPVMLPSWGGVNGEEEVEEEEEGGCTCDVFPMEKMVFRESTMLIIARLL